MNQAAEAVSDGRTNDFCPLTFDFLFFPSSLNA